MELLDCVAAKFHEEPGVFKLLVSTGDCRIFAKSPQKCIAFLT